MLVEFRVSNFRSIRDEVVLSAVSQNPDHSPLTLQGAFGLRLLPVLGVFGANASGKTNVIRALDRFVDLAAIGNVVDRGFTNRIQPFALNRKLRELPSRFRLVVARGGSLYDYQLSCTEDAILDERLEVASNDGDVPDYDLVFERTVDHGVQRLELGSAFANELSIYNKMDKPRHTLLSHMAGFGIDRLSPFLSWLQNKNLGIERANDEFKFATIFLQLAKNEESRAEVVRFLRDFGIDVAALKISQKEDGNEGLLPRFDVHLGRELPNEAGTGVAIPFEEESLGTQQLLRTGWDVVVGLGNGGPVVIDELEAHLHPALSEKLLDLFFDPDANEHGAQMVFSSHEYGLLNRLPRESVWFTQKDQFGATTLYPLSDFEGLDGVDIEKAYMLGRLGARPVVVSRAGGIIRD